MTGNLVYCVFCSVILFLNVSVNCEADQSEELTENIFEPSNTKGVAENEDLKTRIVGGVIVQNRSEVPYQVSLAYKGRHLCGGSILDNRNIITAAHCTEGHKASDLTVAAGHLVITDVDAVRIQVSHIFAHENYTADSTGIDNDIAILRLKEDLTMTDKIGPISLTEVRPQDDAICTVYGWGVVKEGDSSTSKYLRKADLRIVGDKECVRLSGYSLTPNQVCAGASLKDSCQGDSGGPLVSDNKLVGLVSYGIGCARPDIPGVYTDVSKYIKWTRTQQSRSFASVATMNIALIMFTLIQIATLGLAKCL